MTTDHTTQFDLAAASDHAAGTERWIRAAAPDGWLPASVCDLFDHDIPAMAEELERLRDDVAELAQSDAIARATRQMAIDANARLRAQLLEALDREDDGRTPLSTYVAHLVAQRDALKHALGKGVAEEERLRRELDTAWDVAAGNKRHVATLAVLLERVEKLTVSTDGDVLDPDVEIPVGEIRRAIQEPIHVASEETVR